MQVVVNEQHIAQRARSARFHTFAGLGFMLGGLVVSFVGIEYIGWAYGSLLAGLFFFNAGARDRLRFARRPREDELVATALRGLDHRYRLVQYLPGVPAPHVLLTPGGVFVFELRHHYGNITATGTRYERRWNWLLMIGALAEGGVGNPARDAERRAAAVRAHLQGKIAAAEASAPPAGEDAAPGEGQRAKSGKADRTSESIDTTDAAGIPVYPVVLFTHPHAQVVAHEPAVPTLAARELKPWLRKQVQRVRVSATHQRQMYQAFEV